MTGVVTGAMTEAVTLWWAWLALAVLFGMLEVVLPAFVFLGFAAGAAATGLLLLVGMDTGAGWTLLLFALLSLGGYGIVHVLLGRRQRDVRIVTRDVNDN